MSDATTETAEWDGTGTPPAPLGGPDSPLPLDHEPEVTEASVPATADDDGTPMERLVLAIRRMERADAAEPHANSDAEAEYADELVALAARDLVRAVELSDGKPVGWDDDPVHGKPDDPKWAAHREHTCGRCGEKFGSNCAPGDIACPECEARLCSSCGHWEGGEE